MVFARGGVFEPVSISRRSLKKRSNPPNRWTVPSRGGLRIDSRGDCQGAAGDRRTACRHREPSGTGDDAGGVFRTAECRRRPHAADKRQGAAGRQGGAWRCRSPGGALGRQDAYTGRTAALVGTAVACGVMMGVTLWYVLPSNHSAEWSGSTTPAANGGSNHVRPPLRRKLPVQRSRADRRRVSCQRGHGRADEVDSHQSRILIDHHPDHSSPRPALYPEWDGRLVAGLLARS